MSLDLGPLGWENLWKFAIRFFLCGEMVSSQIFMASTMPQQSLCSANQSSFVLTAAWFEFEIDSGVEFFDGENQLTLDAGVMIPRHYPDVNWQPKFVHDHIGCVGVVQRI